MYALSILYKRERRGREGRGGEENGSHSLCSLIPQAHTYFCRRYTNVGSWQCMDKGAEVILHHTHTQNCMTDTGLGAVAIWASFHHVHTPKSTDLFQKLRRIELSAISTAWWHLHSDLMAYNPIFSKPRSLIQIEARPTLTNKTTSFSELITDIKHTASFLCSIGAILLLLLFSQCLTKLFLKQALTLSFAKRERTPWT